MDFGHRDWCVFCCCVMGTRVFLMTHAIAYIDGSGNSDRIQACAVILRTPKATYADSQILPARTTNNVGEYSGLLLALRLAKRLGVEVLQIRSDSKLIVEQVLGNWKCREPELQRMKEKVYETAKGFHSLTISWVPREENKEADALCRKSIKKALKEHPPKTSTRPRPPHL